jgi:hypothetical protein
MYLFRVPITLTNGLKDFFFWLPIKRGFSCEKLIQYDTECPHIITFSDRTLPSFFGKPFRSEVLKCSWERSIDFVLFGDKCEISKDNIHWIIYSLHSVSPKRLSGLRSLWTNPSEWIYSTAVRTAAKAYLTKSRCCCVYLLGVLVNCFIRSVRL